MRRFMISGISIVVLAAFASPAAALSETYRNEFYDGLGNKLEERFEDEFYDGLGNK